MIIVDTIRVIESSSLELASVDLGMAAPTRVESASGVSAWVDASAPLGKVWLEVLDERREHGEPVLLEVEDGLNRLRRLLIPVQDRVESLRDDAEGIEVILTISQTRRLLLRSHPNFVRLFDLLRTALDQQSVVLLSEDDETHHIFDVREGNQGAVPLPRAPDPNDEAATEHAITAGGITLQRARQLFALVSGQSCSPTSPGASCIPFLYPDDGCWGRAHEMKRLIAAAGASVMKVWNYGRLRVATKNSPACAVTWGYHVAPTVLVEDNNSSTVYAIDPSLFGEPVPQLTWKNVQGDPQSNLANSDSRVFYRNPSGEVIYDDNYSQTAQVLRTYRQKLKLRSAGPSGPPPYRCA